MVYFLIIKQELEDALLTNSINFQFSVSILIRFNILLKMMAEQFFNQQFESVLQQEDSSGAHLQDNFDEAAEETLSLCDLAVNGNSEDYWNDGEFSNRQSASDEQDFFEFFSEDFTASSNDYPKDDIIFCGKLIPYKEPAAVQYQTQDTNTQKNIKKSRIFPWKSNSVNKSRSTSSKPQQPEKITYSYKSSSQRNNWYEKFSYEYDFSVKKVSSSRVAAAASIKPRWYLFAFGYGRFSTEMKLRDIKSRQSRRVPAATMFLSDGAGEMLKRSETQKRSSSKGLGTLLRVLGCKSQQANTVAKASFGCIP